MIKVRKTNLLIISLLAIIFAFMSSSRGILAMPEDPFSLIQEKLNGISDEEKVVLQKLFSLEHEIAGMKEEEEGLNKDIGALSGQVKALEASIKDDENSYNKKRDVLKQVLQVYEKRGPGSYLEIILDSKDLNMFLWRISTLQDLSRNTGELLKSLEESRDKLSQKKDELNQKLLSVEDKQKQLKESIDKETQLKKDEEDYLASLKEKRGSYQEQLDNLQNAWDKLKLLFSGITGDFSNVIKEGNIPPDAVKVNLGLNGIEGTIEEKAFNEIAASNPRLSGMSFNLSPGRIEIMVPDMELELKGTFEVVDGNVLKFVAEEGSFFGMELEPEAVSELFEEGSLILDLKQMFGSSTLDSVEILEDRVKFMVKVAFPFK